MKRILQGIRKKQQEAAKPDAQAAAPSKRNAPAPRRTRTARGQANKALREVSARKPTPLSQEEDGINLSIRIFTPKRKGAQP